MTISRGMSRRYVLDANALIAFFEARRGSAERVRHLLGEAARQESAALREREVHQIFLDRTVGRLTHREHVMAVCPKSSNRRKVAAFVREETH